MRQSINLATIQVRMEKNPTQEVLPAAMDFKKPEKSLVTGRRYAFIIQFLDPSSFGIRRPSIPFPPYGHTVGRARTAPSESVQAYLWMEGLLPCSS